MATIRAAHYGEREQALTEDEHVIAMAADLREAIRSGGRSRDHFFHPGEDGTARHEFMLKANEEYHRRSGGQSGGHLGAVPAAIRMILDREDA